jgi:hypothetical protein
MLKRFPLAVLLFFVGTSFAAESGSVGEMRGSKSGLSRLEFPGPRPMGLETITPKPMLRDPCSADRLIIRISVVFRSRLMAELNVMNLIAAESCLDEIDDRGTAFLNDPASVVPGNLTGTDKTASTFTDRRFAAASIPPPPELPLPATTIFQTP